MMLDNTIAYLDKAAKELRAAMQEMGWEVEPDRILVKCECNES